MFANTIFNGDDYCQIIHKQILNTIQDRQPLPVVRFADGEYAFYRKTLGCNGLYQQAESIDTIKRLCLNTLMR